MREQFTQQLDELTSKLVHMGTLVVESLQKAIKAFTNKDAEAAQKIIVEDEKINDLFIEIEEKATILIATEQPVASDLRRIMSIVKTSNNLERIGDHSVHLGKSTIRLKDETYIEPVISMIPYMADICIGMVNDALTAFMNSDVDLAVEVSKRDDEIDRLHEKLFDDIIQIMKTDPDIILQATDLLFIIRFLERLGDHVTHICEWIVYMSSGEHVELNQ